MTVLRGILILAICLASVAFSRQPFARLTQNASDGTTMVVTSSHQESSDEEKQRKYRIFEKEERSFWKKQHSVMTLRDLLTFIKELKTWPSTKEVETFAIAAAWTSGTEYPIFLEPNATLRKIARIGDWEARLVGKDVERDALIGISIPLSGCTKVETLSCDKERKCCSDAEEGNWAVAEKARKDIEAAIGPPGVSVCRTYPSIVGGTDREHNHQWEFGRCRITLTYVSIVGTYLLYATLQNGGREEPVKRLEPLVYLSFKGKRKKITGDGESDESFVFILDFNSNKLLRQDTSELGDMSVSEDTIRAKWSKEDQGMTVHVDISMNRKLGTYDKTSIVMRDGKERARTSSSGTCEKTDVSKKRF